ncbi:MAG: RsmF rRNA methyltransferase first C-terminal domain-containing protein [Lachnospiraceae bacterium]|nr:RsmF rRNA methyltransferase first C-terminal domain-containing protein [Lachnospiraceae bacterium]
MNKDKLPEAFLKRMKEMLGDEYERFLASYDEERLQALRINLSKISVDEYLTISPFNLSKKVPWAEGAFYYSAEERPGKHPHHEAGLYYIQEPSAMAVAEFLDVKPGEKVLDLCAAPGGKTTQTAAKMAGKGLLVANEIVPSRAKILSQNVERLGFANVVVLNEGPDKLAERFEGYFDKIIVDAPCSGEGMFRKDETAVAEWSEDNVHMCAERQDFILDCAVQMLKEGGRMVYSTCTFAPEENEGSVQRLINRNPDIEIEKVEHFDGFGQGNADWWEEADPAVEATMRLWPHKIEGEGHFVAVLRKNAGYEGKVALAKTLTAKNIPADYIQFAKEFFTEEPKGEYMMFGEQLYLVPAEMFSLDKLKVVRPGLHIGTVKKNRFEPAHALALAMKPEQLRNTVNLTSDSPELAAYLRGETLNVNGENGWCVIMVDGYPLGLGKRVNGVVKNHYPKGLRL